GDSAPADGGLPDSALATAGVTPFGVYVHVPFCASRCGYCDFNTYTATELGLAAKVLGGRPGAETVFFGGGTPTMLPAADLVRLLHEVETRLGLTSDVEVTTEANPESVTPASLAEL